MRKEIRFVNSYELHLHNEAVDIKNAYDDDEWLEIKCVARDKTLAALSLDYSTLDFNEYETKRIIEVYASAVLVTQAYFDLPEPKPLRKKFNLN